MLAIRIDEIHTKLFMNKLLRDETFDKFLVRSVALASRIRLDIAEDKKAEEPKVVYFGEIRPMLYELIKTFGRPNQMKLVLSPGEEQAADFSSQFSGLYLNILYDGKNEGAVRITTGMATREFVPDQSIIKPWDNYVDSFVSGIGVRYLSEL